ncbi:hypothetical protein [Zhihengliuella sp.]|uniref:hypothetical protein n=1 Tax=Zhihengliuella sp. TaxID=1954483 RepID=UPI002811865B|nr:hypothetical protein [Zhihengliuella sp.]
MARHVKPEEPLEKLDRLRAELLAPAPPVEHTGRRNAVAQAELDMVRSILAQDAINALLSRLEVSRAMGIAVAWLDRKPAGATP